MPKQTLALHPAHFCIHSLDHDAAIPSEVLQAPIFFIGKTEDELSVVVPDNIALNSEASDGNWRALEVLGPLSLSMVGIMAQLGSVFAKANVSIFVVSTFDTDYFLIKHNDLSNAVDALRRDGYKVTE
ncbi:MAG: amino acid-binding protein [Alteromonadaceae bacterium]|uniref:ACT domain-containing protein n=1 Tax=Paraglaciecola chathamensis TaxID=368405 RepID=UPI000C4F3935|nr:ACT domain-containing protein [Paraglaciecola agarilytica]MBN26524.1 amino acid-binding protein [Alteromonadaceae bacterium]|tara:strand:+ start:75868 stop:76251 length:384 start_codon:yes stop_codon:yes gene_type:complete